ncbi:hypothetical protein J6590_048269 [Homalodisca vitripennis]|nr:hypothetical protein J6590_048269 [Homalodisca vitripennis]
MNENTHKNSFLYLTQTHREPDVVRVSKLPGIAPSQLVLGIRPSKRTATSGSLLRSKMLGFLNEKP